MKIEKAKLRLSSPIEKNGFSPRRLSAFSDSNRSEIIYLDVDVLIPYKNQARKIFLQEELEQMAQSIKDHGVRQPLTIVKRSSEDSYYEVVSGERRLRAAKMADLKRVPCIVLADLDKAEEIALIENVQRQDLHPVELANALLELSERRGWGGQVDLAKKLSMKESYVSESLKIARLPESVKNILIEKNLRGREVLRKVCSLHVEGDQAAYLNAIDEKKKTGAVVLDSSHSVKKESVMRVFMEGNTISTQSGKLKNLTHAQREALIGTLEQVLSDLKSEQI